VSECNRQIASCGHTTLERVRISLRAASVGIARAAPIKHKLAAVAAVLGCLLMGCSAASSSDSRPTPLSTSSAGRLAIPADGVTLATLGYLNGPIQRFSLPRTAVITTKVDQPNNVVAVLSSPSPTELTAYLRRALPTAGFTITADNPAAQTLTFVGNGWSGSVTAHDRVSAVLLRPQ
jgi:hypothetical protein